MKDWHKIASATYVGLIAAAATDLSGNAIRHLHDVCYLLFNLRPSRLICTCKLSLAILRG